MRVLPPMLWKRIRDELGGYLVERGAAGNHFLQLTLLSFLINYFLNRCTFVSLVPQTILGSSRKEIFAR